MRSIARSIAGHWLIASTIGVVVTVLALGTGLVVANAGAIEPWDVLAQLVFVVGGSLGFTLVGSTILIQRPGHRIGRLMMVMGVSLALSQGGSTIVGALDLASIRSGATLDGILTAVDSVGFLTIVMGGVLLVVWFPDGRTTSRLGTLVLAIVVLVAIIQAVYLLDPTASEESGLGFTLLLGTYGLALLDLLLRYRRSEGVRRTQIRWVLASGSVTVALVVAVVVFGDRIDWLWQLWIVSTILPPVAVSIAITRYRLYEIDRIISRTIGYAVMSVTLLVVFGGINLGLQSAIGGITREDPLVVAASTLTVAALFNPLRSRVQSVVDRRFNRARYDAERTAAGFAGRLRDQLDLATLAGELHRTTADAVQPSHAAVWLRTDRAGSSAPGHR